MTNQYIAEIEQFLSLRTPQKEALKILADIVDKIELSKTSTPSQALEAIATLETPKIRKMSDFERSFPSLCFSLATGVGKTRLMGAFITYLYLEKGIKNFFIVAPNLTIYNKLITDFRDISSPKYVFKGVPELTGKHQPFIITGDDYLSIGGLDSKYNQDKVKINIFNISKINRDDKSDKKTGVSKFRSFKENLGESYFKYLQGLDDLVILMDEAHRYRADAGMKTLNAIRPILGLELTATARTAGKAKQSKDFKNIIYHYSLANAILDGYVKKPAIVGRSDFEKTRYDEAKIEEIKLSDGFKVHEDIKAELLVYADRKRLPVVKPFVLIIAKDTTHADELNKRINSQDFMNGKYNGKSIVVHSNQKSVESDENTALLLEVEKTENPVEVVIHVNMLAEGWDVNNLYTIIPLKKADSKNLVEQSIGRGLRLPYGEHTGVDTLDTLNIVAHDNFNDIVETAKKEGFEFQKKLLDEDPDAGKQIAVESKSKARELVENAFVGSPDIESHTSTPQANPQSELKLTFENQFEKEVAIIATEKLEDLGKIVSTSEELTSQEMQERLLKEVKEELAAKGNLFAVNNDEVIKKINKKMTIFTRDMNIKIPQIRIYKAFPNKSAEYKRFELDLTPFNGLQGLEQKIIIQEIMEQKTQTKGEAVFVDSQENLEEYILVPMLNDIAFSYRMMDTLLFFVRQVVAHIQSNATDELELKKILFFNAEYIINKMAEQMKQNVIEPEMETIVKVNGDYTPLRSSQLKGNLDDGELSFRKQPKNPNRIRNFIFIGFKKSLSTKAKFDSNTERELSVILEDEINVLKWDRLSNETAKEKIPISYVKENKTRADYCVDFVVEAVDKKYIIETKAEKDMTAKDVLAKKEAAIRWCEEATKYEQSKTDGKPWHYVLIPHNEFVGNRSFDKLINDWSVR